MVDRKVMAFALAAVMVVGVIGPNVATMIIAIRSQMFRMMVTTVINTEIIMPIIGARNIKNTVIKMV